MPCEPVAELALAYLGLVVTPGGFVLWYSAIGILSVERAGLFSGVLPISALACSAAIGAAEITSLHLAGVVVVAAGVTLGVRIGAGRGETQTQAQGALQHA